MGTENDKDAPWNEREYYVSITASGTIKATSEEEANEMVQEIISKIPDDWYVDDYAICQ